ncbi:hypothetical protein XAPC_1340 [Xanthomonas citri pv. punicae str. LMG 859]|nr:hypothetical protein XAPC_1340 [Xanthomonas citri pv. punicae str. LMG 859]
MAGQPADGGRAGRFPSAGITQRSGARGSAPGNDRHPPQREARRCKTTTTSARY